MDPHFEARAEMPRPYVELLGMPGGRTHLPTPALLIELDALEHNIARMAAFVRQAGLALRPHVKTHKSVAIARRQLACGAVGVSCATIDELEVMAAAGLRGLLLTSPIVSTDKLARAMAVIGVAPDTLLAVDHPEGAELLARQAQRAGVVARVLADVDLGHHRSGARTQAQVDALFDALLALPGLKLEGIQAYAGHLQHVPDHAERVRLSIQANAWLQDLKTHLCARLGRAPIVSGGGTGTHRIDAQFGVYTELQAGSYVFLDQDYGRIDLGLPAGEAYEIALLVRACVTSVNSREPLAADAGTDEGRLAAAGRGDAGVVDAGCRDVAVADMGFVSIDAGTKAFALNGPLPRCVTAPWQACGFRFMGDEHAHLIASQGETLPRLGSALEFVTSHCDPTVHHFDHYYVVRGDVVLDIWPVDARGRR